MTAELAQAYSSMIYGRSSLRGFHSCNSKDWRKEIVFFDKRYGKRVEAVVARLVEEYGPLGNFIITGGCQIYRSDRAYFKALKARRAKFAQSLHALEARYAIDPTRNR